MAKVLNFNKLKKQYMTVTLNDANETTILIGTPTKKMMDELSALGDMLENGDENSLDELYACCATVMSRNKGGVKVEKELLEAIFDTEDIMVFYSAYLEFISEIAESKNS